MDDLQPEQVQQAVERVRCFAREYDSEFGIPQKLADAILTVLRAAEGYAAAHEDAERFRVLKGNLRTCATSLSVAQTVGGEPTRLELRGPFQGVRAKGVTLDALADALREQTGRDTGREE